MEKDAGRILMGGLKTRRYLAVSSFFVLTDEIQLHIIQVKEDELHVNEDEFRDAFWNHMAQALERCSRTKRRSQEVSAGNPVICI